MSKLPEILSKIWKNPETRNRILVTIFVLFIYRLLANIPVINVDINLLNNAFAKDPILQIYALTTGGNAQPTFLGLGLSGYITASIIIQLLQTVIPKLDELAKQGQQGRIILNQITKILTIPMTLISVLTMYILTSRSGSSYFPTLGGTEVVAVVSMLIAGTMFLIWLSDIITESGIGQGSTILIMANILHSLPGAIGQDLQNFIQNSQTEVIIALVLGLLLLLFIVVYFTEAVRKIPLQYASRFKADQSTDITTSQSNFPIRVNMAGVMPVIFATALVSLPQFLISALLSGTNPVISPGRKLYDIAMWFNNVFYNLTDPSGFMFYIGAVVLLIFLFTIFFSFVQLKPQEVSDNIKKSGAFIPGIRPGIATTEFIQKVAIRVGFIGAAFLALVALIPNLARFANLNAGILYIIGGTSILILVTGVLETFRQMKSLIVGRSYDRYQNIY